MMKVLVINAGSSSLKYQIIDMDNEQMICKGLVENVGMKDSNLCHKVPGKKDVVVKKIISNHTEALQTVIDMVTDKEHGVISSVKEIGAVGHRVLHSGEDFNDSVLIDDEVIGICKKNSVLGPLHMPANIACIESCEEVMPGTPMVAVFDTGFHRTMPKHAFMYAIPYDDYENYKIRKYGFHGTSHKYVTGVAMDYLGTDKARIITCHLGNGSSISAVKDGKCIDTSMGLTPLEGVIMGTRSGDVDPAVVEFMAQCHNISVSEVLNILNKKSGFKGICDESDFRKVNELAAAGNEKAKLAVGMFAYRIRKYIGSYYVALGGVDCIVLTGGIGENSIQGRAAIMNGLEFLGIDFDYEKNNQFFTEPVVEVSKPGSKIKVLIIKTNEELVIARDAVRLTAK